MFEWILKKYKSWKRRRKIQKRLKEIKKRDPFIYK
jgi:hypothetical protein